MAKVKKKSGVSLELKTQFERVQLPDLKSKISKIRRILKKSPNLDYLHLLTNQTGIIQHATHGIPDLKNGYAIDDNARGLIVAIELNRQYKDKTSLRLAKTYLSFLDYMQDYDGRFYTYLAFNHTYPNKEKSEDGWGRAMWALGFTIYGTNDADIKQRAEEIFSRSVVVDVNKIKWPRTWAYALIGLYYFYLAKKENETLSQIKILSDKLVTLYEKQEDAKNNWYWFEDRVTYGNAILPLSLLYASKITDNKKQRDIAEKSLQFLVENTMVEGHASPIGEKGWWAKGHAKALFDQQPIEIGYTVWALVSFFKATRKKIYLELAEEWFLWFYGANILNQPLYDEKTGMCRDGLTTSGVNRNGGAESIVTYLIARLSLAKAIS